MLPTGHSHNGPSSSKFSPRRKERILYLQVSEAMVDLVTISRQGMQPDHEEYRYPHAGTPNAVSDLQIVEFVPKQCDEVTILPYNGGIGIQEKLYLNGAFCDK